jgi:hypothetical protein
MWGWGVHAPLTDYWTDFESENGFHKVLPLATILVQGFVEHLYLLTPEGPIHTKSPSLDNRALDRLLDRFWIWKRFWEGIATGYNTGTGFLDQSLYLALQGPIRTNSPSQIIGPGPLDKLLVLFWIWKRAWEGVVIDYNTGTFFIDQSYSTPQGSIRTKSPSPDNRA